MLVDLSLCDPGGAYADMILSQQVFYHRYLERLEVLLCSQPVDLLSHGQGLRGDNNVIEIFVNGGAALVVYLYDVGVLYAKALEQDRPQILLSDLKAFHCSCSALFSHLVGGQSYYYLSLIAKLKGAPQQGDMPIMNGIEGASYCNSGHTGPQTREPYKNLAAVAAA